MLTNDTDPDGETLTVTAKTNPTNGTLTLEAGVLKYTPNAGFRGTDRFEYTVSDGNGGTDTAQVRVQVAASNVPPIGTNDILQTKLNTAIEIAPLANDSSGADAGEVLRVTAFTQPAAAAGSVTQLASGNLVFTPKTGFSGKATFTYTVSDPLDATDVATIEVTVLPITPSELAGVVFLDLNGNGAQDDNESGIADVTVTLSGKDQSGATVNKVVTSNLTGAVSLRGSQAGRLHGYPIAA